MKLVLYFKIKKNQVELLTPPKILTEWEIKKFGLKDTGYKPIEIESKKLIQFV